MPIRRSVNASSRETPPKSKPAEGEEVKAGTVTVLERLMSIQTQAGSETPAKLSQDENIIGLAVLCRHCFQSEALVLYFIPCVTPDMKIWLNVSPFKFAHPLG